MASWGKACELGLDSGEWRPRLRLGNGTPVSRARTTGCACAGRWRVGQEECSPGAQPGGGSQAGRPAWAAEAPCQVVPSPSPAPALGLPPLCSEGCPGWDGHSGMTENEERKGRAPDAMRRCGLSPDLLSWGTKETPIWLSHCKFVGYSRVRLSLPQTLSGRAGW